MIERCGKWGVHKPVKSRLGVRPPHYWPYMCVKCRQAIGYRPPDPTTKYRKIWKKRNPTKSWQEYNWEIFPMCAHILEGWLR